MTWVRIDDRYNEHPKLAKVGPLGQALWLVGLAYSNRNLTDGFIPWSTAGTLMSWDYLDGVGARRLFVGGVDAGVSEEGAVTSDYVIGLLVDAGVWDICANGYRIHDYADYQFTKAQVLAERAHKVAAGRAGGTAAAIARATADGQQTLKQKASPYPYPYPNRSSSSLPPVIPLIVDNQKQTPEEYAASVIEAQERQTGVKV